MNCQTFKDYDNMSFTFVCVHNDNQYVIDGGDVTPDIRYVGHESDPSWTPPEGEDVDISSVELFFKIKWTQEMGVLGATGSTRRNKWNISLVAKTSSGFSYRVPFGLTTGQKQTLPTTEGEGGKVQTNGIQITEN
jgi:hypothetical protein